MSIWYLEQVSDGVVGSLCFQQVRMEFWVNCAPADQRLSCGYTQHGADQ